MRTALYRHYDLNNVLLYVGVSLSTMTRFNQHIQCSDWATDSARMDIEWFDTREMALAAEKKAIKNESPRFNISHSLINKPVKKIKVLEDSKQSVNDIGIFNMPRSVQRVLGYIIDGMNYKNEITIASGGKTKMLLHLRMKPQTLNNALSLLAKSGIIGNPYKGVYIANAEARRLKNLLHR